MKTRLRLKRWVTASVYASLVLIVFISMLFVSSLLDKRYGNSLTLSYVLKDIIDDDIPVNTTAESIIKPFDKESVTIDIDYYNKDSNEENQQKSLILYENTYMPNTGILYTNNEQFDVLSTLDGKVTKIDKDELLGNVIEITHKSNLVTTYYSIDNINVTMDQEVKQGDIIATSGKNNISSTSDNMMLFEVSLNGNNINPNDYYEMKLEDLN